MRLVERRAKNGLDGFACGVIGHLANQAEMCALACRQLAAVRLYPPAQNLEERGLARAVWADDADAFTLGNDERKVLKQRRNPKSFGQSLSADDRWQVLEFPLKYGPSKDSSSGVHGRNEATESHSSPEIREVEELVRGKIGGVNSAGHSKTARQFPEAKHADSGDLRAAARASKKLRIFNRIIVLVLLPSRHLP